jgi:hypothetical protein
VNATWLCALCSPVAAKVSNCLASAVGTVVLLTLRTTQGVPTVCDARSTACPAVAGSSDFRLASVPVEVPDSATEAPAATSLPYTTFSVSLPSTRAARTGAKAPPSTTMVAPTLRFSLVHR